MSNSVSRKKMNQSLLILAILTLVSCGTFLPPKSITQAPMNDIQLAEILSGKQDFRQSLVRWGGRIITAVESRNSSSLTLEVLELSLDKEGQPLDSNTSFGRFIAKIQPPYNKSAYYRNQVVTFVGNISGTEKRVLKSGDTQLLPVIDVQEQYIWYFSADKTEEWPRSFLHGRGAH
jgi:starvation-inducible outer membrane lipoprotein